MIIDQLGQERILFDKTKCYNLHHSPAVMLQGIIAVVFYSCEGSEVCIKSTVKHLVI